MSTFVFAWRFKSSSIVNYASAVLLAGVAVAGAVAFDRVFGTGPSVSLFLCTIMFIAWANGTRPASLAAALIIAAFAWFFLEPAYSFGLEVRDLARVLLFAIAALFVVLLSAAYHRSANSLRRARDEQRGLVRELQDFNESLSAENSERQRAERALQKSERDLAEAKRELQLTIDTIPALASRYRTDGTTDFVNQTWRSYTGLTQESWTARGSAVVHPDDRPRVEQAWAAHLAAAEPFEIEQRMRRADGEYRWYLVRRVPLRDDGGNVIAWYGAGYDIEDRKRAELALRQSEARLAEAQRELQATIDTIPVLVTGYTPEGIRDSMNKTGLDYVGLTLEELKSERWPHLIAHPDEFELIERKWRACLEKGEPFQAELRIRRADGQFRWHLTRRVPLRNGNGSIVRWYAAALDIEDQKRAEDTLRTREAELADAQRELQLTLDRIPILAWQTRSDGYAEYLNKRWLDYTGLPLEQALGWEWQVAVHPDDLPGLLERWRDMLVSGNAKEVEARMRRFDGEYRWFLFRPSPLLDEAGNVIKWYGTNTDIEDRKRAESALKRSEAYLAEAQKLSLTGSFGWNIATGESYWSEEFYKIMGLERRIKPSFDIVMQRTHPDNRSFVQSQLDRAMHGQRNFDYEHRLLMPDGQIKHLHVRAQLVRDASGADEMIGAMADVTEAKRAQEALQAAQAELAHASRVAVLGEMSASIAHEVNQPLAAIVANGQACLRFLAREQPDLNDVRGTVEWIVKDANRAGEVIQRVRALTKKSDTHRAALNINDAVDDAIGLLQREIWTHRISLQTDLATGLPSVLVDPVQLQQVIINLIMNAIEAMHAVEDRLRRLAILSYQDDLGQVVVAVKDSGPGLIAENQDRLFHAFFSTKPGGLGMGLSICRSIIEAHGGRLSASTNVDHGATFKFALPVAEAV
jgi:PAS domain S-box-containing protein